jgi:hypothetical protein
LSVFDLSWPLRLGAFAGNFIDDASQP